MPPLAYTFDDDTDDLDPAVAPTPIAVDPLTNLKYVFEVAFIPCTLAITKIVFEELDGVIETESPVTSVHAFTVADENVSVFVVLTT